MHRSDLSVRKAAYGLAFAIEDLILLRSWAEHRHLKLTIELDRTLDGAEFEEILVLVPARARARRSTLTLWRTKDGIFAQTATSVPHGFATMPALLGQLQPARSSSGWRQRLGLAS